jgi:hypothetical protein
MTPNPTTPIAQARIGQKVSFDDHGTRLTGIVFGHISEDLLQVVTLDDERIFEVLESGVTVDVSAA